MLVNWLIVGALRWMLSDWDWQMNAPRSAARSMTTCPISTCHKSGAHLLAQLPDGLVERAELVGDAGHVLDRAAGGDDAVLHLVVPDAERDEVAQEPRVDDLELAGEDWTRQLNSREDRRRTAALCESATVRNGR